MRNNTFGIPLLFSCVIHATAILIGSMMMRHSESYRQNVFPVRLINVPSAETSLPIKPAAATEQIKKASLPPPRVAKPMSPLAKAPLVNPETREVKPIKEEPARPPETKPSQSAETETQSSSALDSSRERGGSEAGTGSLFAKGNVGVVPGTGTSGGGGTALSGLGRGSGAPGLPAPWVPIQTNRAAKAIETARASYPPMALRMGIEGDVTLKIVVDGEGKVTKAEVIKSGGAGFDEEALKAVKQSRFEPAQRDGRNVPAEFTYVYHFRLRR